MHIRPEPLANGGSRPELIEIVTPRTNTATLTATENLLASLALDEPFSLEIAATSQARWFLVRTASEAMRHHLAGQLAVAYPQADVRRLDLARYSSLDPAHLQPSEQVVACSLYLRDPQYLPLRTFRDFDLGDQSGQADPILGILGALADLPHGWRAISQVVLQSAPDNWCRGYLRLALESPLAAQHPGRAATSLASVCLMAGLLIAGALSFQAYQWWLDRVWLPLLGLVGGVAISVPVVFWLVKRLTYHPLYDPQFVKDKISRPAFRSQLRLAVFAPADVSPSDVETRLTRLAVAYRQFSLATGNCLVPRPLRQPHQRLDQATFLGPRRSLSILNVRELAGLWHLPHAATDVPLVERTGARRWLPLPYLVARGCRIGVSSLQGRSVPVALPNELLRHHSLLVAKTRRGKSSLLLHLARHLMTTPIVGTQPSTLILVDPHRDLAHAALGLVPPHRQAAVVYLDVANVVRPFGLNLLDVGLGWDRDSAISNVLAIFRREFDRFWGPRMEDAFRFAALTLYAANEVMCVADPRGRARQYTVLEVPALLADESFRKSVLTSINDPLIQAWWRGYFEPLDRRLQTEIINPVQTKVQRFAGSRAARMVVGQPASTIDPRAWLRSSAIVIVNTAKGVVGEDTAALIGGTVLNLVELAISAQASLPQEKRHPVTLLVDEFHTLPGVDYEAILSELAKYGANVVLATQSLARLEALDRLDGRHLRSTVFANLDGLFAFQTSAEDAEYLVPELGGEIDLQDLVTLAHYNCYASLTVNGERLPPFSVQLDPPPNSDANVCQQLAAQSGQKYGRSGAAVDADLQVALGRLAQARRMAAEPVLPRGISQGLSHDRREVKSGVETSPHSAKKQRNEHRNQKSKSVSHQASLLDQVSEAALDLGRGEEVFDEGGDV